MRTLNLFSLWESAALLPLPPYLHVNERRLKKVKFAGLFMALLKEKCGIEKKCSEAF